MTIAASLAEEDGPRADLNSFGAFKAAELTGRTDQGSLRQYRYRFVYENETVMVRCTFNADGKISGLMFQPE